MHARKTDIESLGRLRKRPEFLRAGQSGRKWVSGSVIVQIAENGLGEARFGLTVSKKTSGNAVNRNRTRRRLRAAARDVLPAAAAGGYDYVLIGRNGTADAPYENLVRDLRWCIKRLGCAAAP